MYFNKSETSNNFTYGPIPQLSLSLVDCGDEVFRLQAESPRWPQGNPSFADLSTKDFAGKKSLMQCTLSKDNAVSLSLNGSEILSSKPARGFGVCGKKWILTFPYNPGDCFYGMGEKNIGFELSGKRTVFWNTDIFADFDYHAIEHGSTDPMYASFPVLIIRKASGHWLGLVVNNPYPVFMNTGAEEGIFQPGAGPFIPELFLGARDGQPEFYILGGPDPASVVQKIQKLQGTHALPPLWALGHQQCRWGYKSPDELSALADKFEKHGIPNDGLWLDIDYMKGYRVFTVNPEHFPSPQAQLKQLEDRGYHVVPILDPGFRQDPAYSVYAEAKKADLLCKTPEASEFIGYVWPGYTVFPDFSLAEAREFWANEVAKLSELGFAGYWIDMNDPSTGSVNNEDMCFSHGTLTHDSWHNQYALGMAAATHTGLTKHKPTLRTFLISRSAFLGQAKYGAVWTGDNISNPHHMKNSLAISLNLSVSGMPWNGPDVPGFAGDASAELMRAWYKLGFLFPFFRNHSIMGSRVQEPWTFDKVTTVLVRDYIRLRYKLLPYLYQIFVEHHQNGSPILRPIWYHDDSQNFLRTDTMFFVGPSILQAPFVNPNDANRSVELPKHSTGTQWYDTETQKIENAGTILIKTARVESSPLFIAVPSILPMQRGIRTNNSKEFDTLDLVICLEAGQSCSINYQLDDGSTTAAYSGQVSLFTFTCTRANDGRIQVEVANPKREVGGLNLRLLSLLPSVKTAIVTKKTSPASPAQSLSFKEENLVFASTSLRAWASEAFTV